MNASVDRSRLTPRQRAKGRRPAVALASVALVALSVAIFCGIYAKARQTRSVLAISQSVSVGQAIQPGDLVSVEISPSSALDPVPASDADSITGRLAAVSLVPGSLLTRGDLGSAQSLPAGRSVVGVSLKASQMPAAGIVQGEWVMVVLTGQPGDASPAFAAGSNGEIRQVGALPAGVAGVSAGTVIASAVPVVDQAPSKGPAGTDTTVVSLEVPTAIAPLSATASTAGEVALVEVAPGS